MNCDEKSLALVEEVLELATSGQCSSINAVISVLEDFLYEFETVLTY